MAKKLGLSFAICVGIYILFYYGFAHGQDYEKQLKEIEKQQRQIKENQNELERRLKRQEWENVYRQTDQDVEAFKQRNWRLWR